MRRLIFALITIIMALPATGQKKSKTTAKSVCSADWEAKNKGNSLSCKLTTPELRKRKETVIASLKKQVIQRREIRIGYSFTFSGSNKMVDELAEFIKTERACCDFFVFNLSISGDKSEVRLEITGPKGAKEFITTELGM